MSTALTDPVDLGPRRAPCRVMFGPHETNLSRDRGISARHVAYYARRAAGGCGVIVTETASVHPSDWPYERAPLAADCGPGWAQVVTACRPHGALVLAGLGHAGMQGSSAFSQSALWAPSRVPDAGSRELPMEMAGTEIDAVVDGFAAAAALAAGADLDGVEINAGQHSLLRQFQSGLTNQRGDDYGQDRLLLTERVLRAARGAVGGGRVLGLRLCCDEFAPWAGVTPELAAEQAARLAGLADYLVVVRGSIYSVPATRPDLHTAPGSGAELCRQIRAAVERRRARGAARQRGGPRAGAVGAGRWCRRPGGDDQGADRRSRPRRPVPRRGSGTSPPLRAVQPGLHGPGQQEPGDHLRRRAAQRPRARRRRHRGRGPAAGTRCWSSAAARPGWKLPACWRCAAPRAPGGARAGAGRHAGRGRAGTRTAAAGRGGGLVAAGNCGAWT